MERLISFQTNREEWSERVVEQASRGNRCDGLQCGKNGLFRQKVHDYNEIIPELVFIATAFYWEGNILEYSDR